MNEDDEKLIETARARVANRGYADALDQHRLKAAERQEQQRIVTKDMRTTEGSGLDVIRKVTFNSTGEAEQYFDPEFVDALNKWWDEKLQLAFKHQIADDAAYAIDKSVEEQRAFTLEEIRKLSRTIDVLLRHEMKAHDLLKDQVEQMGREIAEMRGRVHAWRAAVVECQKARLEHERAKRDLQAAYRRRELERAWAAERDPTMPLH